MGDGDGYFDCVDLCPDDENKIAGGYCGCGVADADSDGDGLVDCEDECPQDPNKTSGGVCGCGESDIDYNLDGFIDCDPIFACRTDADCPQHPDYPSWTCKQEWCKSLAPNYLRRRLAFMPDVLCYCYNDVLKVGREATLADQYPVVKDHVPVLYQEKAYADPIRKDLASDPIQNFQTWKDVGAQPKEPSHHINH